MNQKPSAIDALLQELLAAIKANVPVAGGYGRSRAEPSFYGGWRVMDRDCAERVRKAAAALRESVNKHNRETEGMGHASTFPKEALVQELLAAIEANKTIEAGSGLSPYVPTFDRHDREAEYQRPGWELVDEDSAKHVEKAAAALREALRDGV
ncbi:MAG TPA: hypothetical protein VJA94_22560 [Candidatus Angelobacter sp.]